MSQSFSDALLQEISPLWSQALTSRVYRALLSDEPVGRELLQVYLIETYHYVKHNAQHQALAVWHADVTHRVFMAKALKHALEEVDHDQFALSDLERMGVSRADVERSVPLPETLGFTGFLYHWVTCENPIGRLGYSLWAEGTQDIGPTIIDRVMKKFAIEDKRDISFLAAHSAVDMRHGVEARENIDRFAVTPKDRQAVRVVAHTSLRLFYHLLEALFDRYLEVRAGAPLIRHPLDG